jgi:hypothetical protein
VGRRSCAPRPAWVTDLTLCLGVTITGRLVKGGKPLAGVAVGAVQKDRNIETYIGHFEAATDARGVFQIRNVPPEGALALYGLINFQLLGFVRQEVVGLRLLLEPGPRPQRESRSG